MGGEAGATTIEARPVIAPGGVLALFAAAARIDPAAELALRIAAVTGARTAEIAALQWDDLDGHRLTLDSCIVVQRDRDDAGSMRLIDASTKPVDDRTVCLDQTTVQMIERQRAERGFVGPYMFSTEAGPPNPDRIGHWWQRTRECAGVVGVGRLEELHQSFAANVVHVLEFDHPQIAPEPQASPPVDDPEPAPEREHAARRPRVKSSLPKVLDGTALLLMMLFVLLRLI